MGLDEGHTWAGIGLFTGVPLGAGVATMVLGGFAIESSPLVLVGLGFVLFAVFLRRYLEKHVRRTFNYPQETP